MTLLPYFLGEITTTILLLEGEEVGVVMLLVVWAILLGGDNCLLVIWGTLLFGRVLYDLVAACFAGLFP